MQEPTNDILSYKIKETYGKARLQTKDGILCECGRTVSHLFSKCECEQNGEEE